ncbi:hypothetical protein [Flavobacterium sp. 3HN19-14]|uniref:hypothetical protein n=1 Tax=Flavobacterium sp. 3HN19-14 TaxID=3448133 RepID=UPI003EE3C3D6
MWHFPQLLSYKDFPSAMAGVNSGVLVFAGASATTGEIGVAGATGATTVGFGRRQK